MEQQLRKYPESTSSSRQPATSKSLKPIPIKTTNNKLKKHLIQHNDEQNALIICIQKQKLTIKNPKINPK